MRLASPGLAPSVDMATVNCSRRRMEGRINVQYAGTSTMLTSCPRCCVSVQTASTSSGLEATATTTNAPAKSPGSYALRHNVTCPACCNNSGQNVGLSTPTCAPLAASDAAFSAAT